MENPWLEHLLKRFPPAILPNMLKQFSRKGEKNYCLNSFPIRLRYLTNINITWRMPHHLMFFMSTPYVSLSGACEKPPSKMMKLS
jgi:hypothetical protein